MKPSEQQLSEGFQSNQTIIEQGYLITPNQFNFRPIDYEPRVLLRSFIYKKLPDQINDEFDSIANEQINPTTSCQYNKKKHNERVQPQNPFNAYESNIQKFHKLSFPTQIGKFHMYMLAKLAHQISLKHLFRYQQNNFRLLKQCEQIDKQTNNTRQHLIFDSRFQCGNLLCAYQSLITKNQYHLFLENDTNRFGYNQWFMFSIKGPYKDTKYTFKILNFRKSFSFFKSGMKPIFFSLKKHKKSGNGWYYGGQNISYSSSPIYDAFENTQQKLYCLQFDASFDEQDDFITISSGLPYSYSRLTKKLKILKQKAEQNDVQWTQRTIAYSLSNNQVPYLIIKKYPRQEFNQQTGKRRKKKNQKHSQRQIILIFARQHPGQSNSSFIMQKFLTQLVTMTKKQTKFLLQHYQFHIFPMINVDGVIYGNFRCDLAGFDLNRVWKNPVRQIHPQVYEITEKVKLLQQSQKIICCLDFHSHSKQYNIFSYCCKVQEVQSRIFPFLLSKINNSFRFSLCTFGLSRDKYTTARATVFGLVKHSTVLTIQASSFAVKMEGQVKFLSPKLMGIFAEDLCESIKNYVENSRLKKECEQQISARLSQFQALSRQNQQNLSGSDSEVDIHPTNHLKILKQFLPEKTVKKYQIQIVQPEAETKQRNHIKQKQEDQQISNEIFAANLQRYEKCDLKIEVKQKPKYYSKIDARKQQILAIVRTRATPIEKKQKKYENNSIIRLPIHEYKTNPFKYEVNKTEPTNQNEGLFLQQQQKLIQKSKHNRSSIIGNNSTQKQSSKIFLKPRHQVSRFKLKSFEDDSANNNLDKVNSAGDKRNSDLKRLSKIEKILKIRMRANTLKNIIYQESKNQINHIFEFKIGQNLSNKGQKYNTPYKSQNSKLKANKSSAAINKPNDKEPHMQKHSRKNTNIIVANHPNAHTSLIGQLWKLNYGRYSKQLS